MGRLMKELLARLIGCASAGHTFPKPEKDENGMVYLRRKMKASCDVCGKRYKEFLAEVA